MCTSPVLDLLEELAHVGIEIVADGDRLRYRPRSALTPDLTKRVKAYKMDLLAILRLNSSDDAVDTESCEKCKRLMFWWNPLGDRRCIMCDPPTTAIRLLENTQRIRRRHGLPVPPGAVEMLNGLRSAVMD